MMTDGLLGAAAVMGKLQCRLQSVLPEDIL